MDYSEIDTLNWIDLNWIEYYRKLDPAPVCLCTHVRINSITVSADDSCCLAGCGDIKPDAQGERPGLWVPCKPVVQESNLTEHRYSYDQGYYFECGISYDLISMTTDWNT